MSRRASVIDEIKGKLDLLEVIGRYVELRQLGDRWVGVCPFHQETKGSFYVHPERGFFYCFGCQASGDLIEFHRRINGLEFREALEQLALEAGVSMGPGRPGDDRKQRKKGLFWAMHALAGEYFRLNLEGKQGAAARGYLQRRGVPPDISENFFLGWSPDDWHGLEKFLVSKGYRREQAVECGLLSQSKKGHIFDRFRNRLIFPITSLAGRCIAFGARVIDDGEPKYINSSESEIYTKGEHLYGLYQARTNVSQKKEILLTEGYLDVITLHQYGFGNACGVLGTALTASQVKRIAGLVRKVVLVFDGDSAGRKAALRSTELILGQGLECRVIDLPEGEDVDSLLRSSGKSALDYLREKSFEGLDFCFRELNRNCSPREIMDWARNFLNGLGDLSWRAFFIPRIAHELGLAEKEFRQALESDAQKKANKRPVTPKTDGFTGGSLFRDREILSLMICFPEFKGDLQVRKSDLCLVNSWAQTFWRKIKDGTEEDFLPLLNEEERNFYYNSRQRLKELNSQKDALKNQLENFLQEKECEMTREYLLKALSRAEQEGDREEVVRILKLLQKNMEGS